MIERSETTSFQELAVREDFDEFAVYVERLWSQLRRGMLQQAHYNRSLVRPAVDVYQTAEHVVVVVEAPGCATKRFILRSTEPG